MTTTVDTRMLARWLERCAETVEAARGELCALDGEVGDGDHGSSMADGLAAAARAAAHAAARCDGDAGPKAMMDAAGSAFIAAVGATVGPLYATAFFRAGAAVDAGGGVPDLLAAMVDGISARGKARPGDCTMIDAWDPAARAAAAGAAAGQTPREQAAAAALAAREGADATVSMIASRGRAVRLGGRSLGHVDPGARSALLMIEALADVLDAPP